MKPSLAGIDALAAIAPEARAPAQAAAEHGTGSLGFRRIGVISNPLSHYNRKSGPDAIDLPHVQQASPRGRPAIAAKLTEFAAHGVDLLVIDGGDGTVRDVLTEGLPVFADNWPTLLVLPSGKTNALALDLGMPKQLRLGEALQATGNSRLVSRRPILVRRRDGPDRPLMGFLLGAGVFNTVIDTGQVAHRLGAFQSAAVGVTALAGIVQALVGIGNSPWRKTVPMRLVLEGNAEAPRSRHAVEGHRYGLGISALKRFPLGMRPFGKVEGDLRFLVWDRPLRRIIAIVPGLLMGWDPAFLGGLGIFRGSTGSIDLSLAENFILDGESYPAGELRISPGSELQFLIP